jgi:hypothetical protein
MSIRKKEKNNVLYKNAKELHIKMEFASVHYYV